MASKIWSPLDPQRRQIRLAHLAPSKNFNERPICFLSIVSLDDNPQYEALSYAWGDPKVTAPIRLQSVCPQGTTKIKHDALHDNSVVVVVPPEKGHSKPGIKRFLRSAKGVLTRTAMKPSFSDNDYFPEAKWPVTTNLEQALRYLRHKSHERVLWVDAICIDQSNVEERNHQVSFMKAIYSKALVVRIWLGSPTLGSDDAIMILKEMGRGIPLQAIKLNGHLIDDNDLRSVIELNKRPWWYRIWVQQEIVLATKALIYCGFAFLERDELLSRVQIEDMANSAGQSLRFTRDIVSEFQESFSAWAGIDYTLTVYRLSESTKVEYITVIAYGRLCLSSDERDSIYGFLGLLDENIASKIEPDYSASVVDVFRDAAIQLTTWSQSLTIFSLIRYAENKDRGLQTWVPSWHTLSSPESMEDWRLRLDRLSQHNFFSSCGKYDMKFHVDESNTLKILGARFDSVSGMGKVMKVFEASAKWFRRQTLEWQFLCFTDEFHGQARYIAGGTKYEAFWRTLMNDILPSTHTLLRRRVSTNQQLYADWLTELKSNVTTYFKGENTTLFHRPFQEACSNRRLFITKKGYFGIGPAELQVEDEIYIIAGGKHPYALRRVLGPRPNAFELIGDCYVHGIMDGEAVSNYMRTRAFEDVTIDETSGSQESDPDLPLRDFHDIFIV